MHARHGPADVLRQVGRTAKGVPLLDETVTGYARTLGEDHPQTLRARSQLADRLAALGDREPAGVVVKRTMGCGFGRLGESPRGAEEWLVAQRLVMSRHATSSHL
ncbi:tetratricopeptide repeat protein [Streptomyces sp. NPDC058092]|uniref:tetratricopeptide repeat protein n=1 Tax=Streptomyces sp. NPDC058092 TaxID=3346336 RepID=UPI0036DFB380